MNTDGDQIIRAFSVLFPENNESVFWKKAKGILKCLPSEKIDFATTIDCLCEIINHIHFPFEVQESIVEDAKKKLSNILKIDNLLISMIEVEVIQRCIREGKTLEEISKIYS